LRDQESGNLFDPNQCEAAIKKQWWYSLVSGNAEIPQVLIAVRVSIGGAKHLREDRTCANELYRLSAQLFV
jgi:hypothetical protein